MRGLWGDWWHPAAPEHRVQPGLVDCVEGEIDVGLGEVPGKKGRHSGTYKSLCWSCRLITQHEGCVSSYPISSLLTWLYRSSRLLMPDCCRIWWLRFTTEVWIRSGASCLTWVLFSSGVHITWTRHSTSNSYSSETLSPTQLFLYDLHLNSFILHVACKQRNTSYITQWKRANTHCHLIPI